MDSDTLAVLAQLERKVLWLASWMVHNGNHRRENADGLKVGGHQASSASLVSIMTALYFAVLKPEDRVAVKPHASPVFHAIQYLLGNQTREKLENFRGFGGAQSYPSRTKDTDDVDFSTGSVGLGVAITAFASMVQDYVHAHGWMGERPKGRMIALVGDAELDEGNIYEALLESWKFGLKNTWWIIDYNRQSLDAVVREDLHTRFEKLFAAMGWDLVVLKYGKLQQAAFAEAGGDKLKAWIDSAPNQLYSALTFQGGQAWRKRLLDDLGDQGDVSQLIEKRSDAELAALMCNLGGHDVPSILEAFQSIDHDRPVCFLCYTVKGFGLPLAGHKDNHAGLMSEAQIEQLRETMSVREGHEWEPFEGLSEPADTLKSFLAAVPFVQDPIRRLSAPQIAVPPSLVVPQQKTISTQAAFGNILNEIGREQSELAARIVTTSPDVTVSTNLGAWVNRRGLFGRDQLSDLFREQKIPSAQRWETSPRGQHIELGIAEMNLFLLLGAMGLSHSLFGTRLVPIGTLYDPFIARGLDALNYACYQDARFMLVATPSGVTLAPEGGAHQSIHTPLIGIGQPGLLSYEPAYVDELAVLMRFGLDHMQQPKGSSIYLRLSTRSLAQPQRALSEQQKADIVSGGYWYAEPEAGADIAIVCMGAVTPEAIEAHRTVTKDFAGAGLLVLTSPDRLHGDWLAAQRERGRTSGTIDRSSAPVERLLAPLSRDARIVTVMDGHPLALSWLGSVRGQRVVPLGIETFGQSADIPDLYRAYKLDAAAIIDAVARAV
ncbi:MAG TPA: 1-deoxy-D-xylulose-5-phosphate synthase N-terminal domain-containing protein [Reyranella sp.]|nr:1-deoxy-D-xylulose-5-phosphate synthase N-terminal domain-containing protein [Reyranella sp.]